MKDRKKFLEYMTLLGELHDKKITQILLEAYWKSIEDIPDELAYKIFDQAIAMCKFFPKPADLRELAFGTADKDPAELAWAKVYSACSHIGFYDSVEFDDPVIHSVIKAMGGWPKLCMTNESEMKWKRKEFITLYNTLKGKQDHPDYLPGIIERDNAALGYPSAIPEPVKITLERFMLPDATKKQKQIESQGEKQDERIRKLPGKNDTHGD